MICFRYKIVNTLQEGDYKDDDDKLHNFLWSESDSIFI